MRRATFEPATYSGTYSEDFIVGGENYLVYITFYITKKQFLKLSVAFISCIQASSTCEQVFLSKEYIKTIGLIWALLQGRFEEILPRGNFEDL
jgi:hypothetical protein